MINNIFINNDNNYKVSILMITYNHEKFIAQAIDSVINQKTNFPYELVIGYDYSNDKTYEIISKYEKEYPDKIKILNSDIRIGPNENFRRTYDACSGIYIAILEGDDYWCDENKLQYQIEVLDKNQEMAGCFHHVKKILMDNDEILDFWPKNNNNSVTTTELLQLHHFHISALVFRKAMLGVKLPGVILQCVNCDFVIYLMLSEIYSLGYINKSMSMYRIHANGMWTSYNVIKKYEESIETYKNLLILFKGKYYTHIMANIYNCKSIIFLEKGFKHKALFFEVLAFIMCDKRNKLLKYNHYRKIILILKLILNI